LESMADSVSGPRALCCLAKRIYPLGGYPPHTANSVARHARRQGVFFARRPVQKNQAVAFEFWLRCREVSAKSQYNHWEVKTDFLEKTNRKAEAAKAFQEELKCRLRYMGILAGNPRRSLGSGAAFRPRTRVSNCLRPVRFQRRSDPSEHGFHTGKLVLPNPQHPPALPLQLSGGLRIPSTVPCHLRIPIVPV
jgi:hypothetical protein